MKQLVQRPSIVVLMSTLLALPFMVLFTLLFLHIEPDFGPLAPLLKNPDPDQPNVVGTLVVLGCFVLLLLAFSLNLRVLQRSRRAGGGVIAHPLQLVLAGAMLLYIVLFIGGIIVDQYPCWVGVPNCD